MCVTAAIKLPRDRDTGEPTKDSQWVLFKIRDRAYDPVYQFKTFNDGDRTTLFLVDEDSDWTECIRANNKTGDTELMFVNSALDNSRDRKDGVNSTPTVVKASHGLIARRTARSADLEDAIKAFEEMRFDGCTFISDGKKCFLIESSLPNEVNAKLKKIKDPAERKKEAAKHEFVTTTEEVTDWLAVRSNHGVTNDEVGYEESDGISFRSSENRRNFAEAYIREHVFAVSDIIPAVDAMGEPPVHKNPYLRPRRVHKDIQEWVKAGGSAGPIYSTSAFVMTSGGNCHVKLYDAGISKANIQKLYDKEFPIKVSITR